MSRFEKVIRLAAKTASKPILGAVGPWLPPVRAGQRGLTVFLFHDVTDLPSPFSHSVGTHVSASLFLRQLSWIQDRFTVLHPLDIEHGEIPPGSALLTFDDGFSSFRETALPILENARLPGIVFLNMDVVEGSPNSAALAVWSSRRNGYVGNPWEVSLPEQFGRAIESLESPREWAAFREFQGTYLDKADLAALDGHPLVTFGSHLSNHWHSPGLTDREFEEAVLTNQARLQVYRHGMPWLAYPFGLGTSGLDGRAEANGITRLFTGRGLLNPDPGQKVLHRVDLNGEIRNRPLFRWRLSTRTALASLRGREG